VRIISFILKVSGDFMPHRSHSGRKPHKRSHTQGRSTGKTSSTRPPARSRRGKKEIQKFDPSQFMKKVEEQALSAVYVPRYTFSDFLIDDQIKKNIIKKGYITPTPIQDLAIPLLLEGKDVIATANTGTGKTAAFLIPLINNVVTQKTARVLIVVPTRELAEQIQTELRAFSEKMGLFCTVCIGGVNIMHQIRELRNDPAFVIGTPGRLIDLEKNRQLNFAKYSTIVLDEVDRMLDMGFITDIKYIINKLPPKRHSLFFSATIPPMLKTVMHEFLRNPVIVSVKNRQSAENVNQEVVKIGQKNKIDLLHDLLIKPECKKVIIFLRTKRAADKLAQLLRERGFVVSAIHGDKSQAQRKKALSLFKHDHVTILVATDVVARGIDIDDVSHVINFDLPQTYEDYIHRIGRTGRADKIGQAITFIE
jgi:ATP-dependent RNA helicase RhlE